MFTVIKTMTVLLGLGLFIAVAIPGDLFGQQEFPFYRPPQIDPGGKLKGGTVVPPQVTGGPSGIKVRLPDAGPAAPPPNPLPPLIPGVPTATMSSSAYQMPNPIGPYSPYGYGYPTADPFGGYLKGAADVINAQGQYLINTQQAYMLREDLKRAQLANRRAAYEEWLWERANLPTLEDERLRTAKESVRRASYDPPLPEIWSGQSLNTLLLNAQTMGSSKGQMPNIPLDEEVVSKINLNSGKAGINFGLLKNDGKLTWPLALRNLQPAGESKELRDQMQTLSEAAVKKAKEGGVDPGTLREMESSVDKLEKLLRKNVNELPFSEYTEGKRYVTQLRDGLKALREPNAADFANGKFKLKGNTVQDLLEYMTKNGLQFAPAVGGEEAAYVALHRALATFSQAAGANLAADR